MLMDYFNSYHNWLFHAPMRHRGRTAVMRDNWFSMHFSTDCGTVQRELMYCVVSCCFFFSLYFGFCWTCSTELPGSFPAKHSRKYSHTNGETREYVEVRRRPLRHSVNTIRLQNKYFNFHSFSIFLFLFWIRLCPSVFLRKKSFLTSLQTGPSMN